MRVSIAPYKKTINARGATETSPPAKDVFRVIPLNADVALWSHKNPRDSEFDLIASNEKARDGAFLSEVPLTPRLRSVWEKYLGFDPATAGTSMLDGIKAAVTSHSHPDGLLGQHTCMPDENGDIAVRVQNLGCLFKERIRPLEITTPLHPHARAWNRIQDRFHREYLAIEATDPAIVDQFATCNAQSLDLRYGDEPKLVVPGSRRTQWKTRRPDTVYRETWAGADGTNINRDQTWDEVSGGFEIIGNLCRDQTGSPTLSSARMTSVLSGVNHYAEANVTWRNASSLFAGLATRFAQSSHNYYLGHGNASADTAAILIITTGTTSVLASVTKVIGAETILLRMRSNGSNHTLQMAGQNVVTVYDATYFAAVRCGLGCNSSSTAGNRVEWGTWTARDIVDVVTAGNRYRGLCR
jgi:hypothetical protein